MPREEHNYYAQRALAEKQCAEEATNPHARQIHLKLSALYQNLLEIEVAEGSANLEADEVTGRGAKERA